MKSVLACVPAAIVAGALMHVPVLAKCAGEGNCAVKRTEIKGRVASSKIARTKSSKARPSPKIARTKSNKARPSPKIARTKSKKVRHQEIKSKIRKSERIRVKFSAKVGWVGTATVKPVRPPKTQQALPRTLDDFGTRHFALTANVSPFALPSEQTTNQVMGMINSMSPGYNVPTWFALRIAKIESNYNPWARGHAGEYGVYQIKCDTARFLGFDGACAELSDARTNIHWGLTHLSEALESSNGDLRLAASKHNAGLGRQTLVPAYVNAVF